MHADDAKRIVAGGDDAIAGTYRDWAATGTWPRLEWIALLEAELRDGSDVLELGCGAGVPVTRRLVERHRVTGVDLSVRQIELARADVPHTVFVHADALAFDPESTFDAVVSLSVSGHVPRHEQAGLLRLIAGWVRREATS